MRDISITESRHGISRLDERVWTFRTYPNGVSVENYGIALGDRIFPVTPQASPLKPTPGFSPEGGTSLPLVRKPPDPGNNTTILFFLDAPASFFNHSQLDIYSV